jgi:outer membrane protein insertion porin family
LAAAGQLGQGIQFVLALTAKSGFIFGDAGPFFTELYSMGGVQFGIPLRGYNEFSITPNGYDPNASSGQASVNAFGQSFAAFTVEAGARISSALYVDTFLDAGNVYRTVSQIRPHPSVPGAGFGWRWCRLWGPWGSISRTVRQEGPLRTAGTWVATPFQAGQRL